MRIKPLNKIGGKANINFIVPGRVKFINSEVHTIIKPLNKKGPGIGKRT